MQHILSHKSLASVVILKRSGEHKKNRQTLTNIAINVHTWLMMMSLCLQPVNIGSCTDWVLGELVSPLNFDRNFSSLLLIDNDSHSPHAGLLNDI